MVKKTVLISIVATAISLLVGVQQASAHFMVKDATSGVQALFHVTPDHSPIAGKESVISYDFGEAGIEADDFSYLLAVKSTKSEAVRVPVDISGDVVLASYIFPTKGFYTIPLTAKNTINGEVSKLEYGHRVSRGKEVKESNIFGSLEVAAIAGLVFIAVSAIIFSLINDRKGDRHEKRNRK